MKISIMNNAPSINKGNQQHTNKNEISFKGINIIYVPKGEFKRPFDPYACLKEVDKIINKKNWFFSLITKGRNINSMMKTKGREYIEVDSMNAFVDIETKRNYHAFAVITGKEKEIIGKEITKLNIFRQTLKWGNLPDAIRYIIDIVGDAIEEVPKNIIQVESLSELNSIKLVK